MLATILNNLALLYRSQSNYEEAESLFKKVLKINEAAETTDRVDFAVALGNLASLYRLQGRLTEAEPLYKRSLGIYERSLGHTHPDVVGIRNAYYSLLYDLNG